VCGFAVSGSASLCRFALRSLAVWRVRAIAPSFIFGWRAFSSVSLCKSVFSGVLALFPAGGPFLPSLYVNLYSGVGLRSALG
jgi:hypothetical protein